MGIACCGVTVQAGQTWVDSENNDQIPLIMSPELQSAVALGIVLLTAGIFVYRAFRVKNSGCGGACGCPQKPNLEKQGKSLGRP
jgi:hypothetical protein